MEFWGTTINYSKNAFKGVQKDAACAVANQASPFRCFYGNAFFVLWCIWVTDLYCVCEIFLKWFTTFNALLTFDSLIRFLRCNSHNHHSPLEFVDPQIVLSIDKIYAAQPEVVNIMFKTVGVLLSLPKAEPRGVQGMSQERSRRQVGDMSWTHTNHKMSGKHTITIKSHEFKHRGQGILHVLFTPCNISLFL